MTIEDDIAFLERVPSLAAARPRCVAHSGDRLGEPLHARRQSLFGEGDDADGAYVVQEGSFDLVSESRARSRRRSPDAGTLIGEIALLTEDQAPGRRGRARALDAWCAFRASCFLKMLEGYPDAARAHARRASPRACSQTAREFRPRARQRWRAGRRASEPALVDRSWRCAHLAPKIPPHEFGAVVDHALDSAGLKNAAPEAAAWLSLVAYVRHVFTDYDDAAGARLRPGQRAPFRRGRDGGGARRLGRAAEAGCGLIPTGIGSYRHGDHARPTNAHPQRLDMAQRGTDHVRDAGHCISHHPQPDRDRRGRAS